MPTLSTHQRKVGRLMWVLCNDKHFHESVPSVWCSDLVLPVDLCPLFDQNWLGLCHLQRICPHCCLCYEHDIFSHVVCCWSSDLFHLCSIQQHLVYISVLKLQVHIFWDIRRPTIEQWARRHPPNDGVRNFCLHLVSFPPIDKVTMAFFNIKRFQKWHDAKEKY